MSRLNALTFLCQSGIISENRNKFGLAILAIIYIICLKINQLPEEQEILTNILIIEGGQKCQLKLIIHIVKLV
jgi:hypothetical protein